MPVTVAVCRKCKDHQCLVDILDSHADVSLRLVKCQKICRGPVVGLPVAGRMEWFEQVNTVKGLAALVRVTRHPERQSVPKPLRKRRVKKYSGRAPRG